MKVVLVVKLQIYIEQRSLGKCVLDEMDIPDHISQIGRTLWSGVYYPKGLQGDENKMILMKMITYNCHINRIMMVH